MAHISLSLSAGTHVQELVISTRMTAAVTAQELCATGLTVVSNPACLAYLGYQLLGLLKAHSGLNVAPGCIALVIAKLGMVYACNQNLCLVAVICWMLA